MRWKRGILFGRIQWFLGFGKRKSFCWTTYMLWIEDRKVISWNNGESMGSFLGSGYERPIAVFECDRFLCLEYFRNYSNS
jgi:hypothetical protein